MIPSELRIVTAFRSMAAFANLDPLHIHKLAAIAAEKHFDEGEIIYRAGDRGDAVYLILEGEVAVEMGVEGFGSITLFSLGPGQLFGWSSMFPNRRKQALARVVRSTQLIAINASQLRALFRADHELERMVMDFMTQVIVDRVRGARLELAKTLAAEKKHNEEYFATVRH